jgi:hypothetical protein
MTQTGTAAAATLYTDPNTGKGIPCTVLSSDDGTFEIELVTGQRGLVTAGELYCLDESGRYLGGPASD